MGKTGKWIRNFLTGKKDKKKEKNIANQSTSVVANGHPTTPISTIPSATPKEKKRWSFRRSSTSEPGQDLKSRDIINVTTPSGQQALMESENDEKKHALAMAAATAAAADAAVAAAKVAAAVIQLTASAVSERATAVEDAAAIKIQSYYRAYLARKALNALRGLVKLQALVRGHLVRKQAAVTLRCIEALVTVQARARAQRLWMVEESQSNNNQRQFNHRNSAHENRSRHSYQDFDRGTEENVKIVEVDPGEWKGSTKGRNSYSNQRQTERFEHRISTHRATLKHEQQQISPAPSAITDMSPRAFSGHFEEYSFDTAQSSPPYYSAVSKPHPSGVPFSYARSEYGESPCSEYPFYPSYMANTESSRAKVRSHSAPKQRPESLERQPSRRRPSIEGRNVPRCVKMQRSSSHVGSTAQNYQYPWSLKLDGSTVSLKGSECGSTSTVLTNTNYCRSLVGFEVHGNRY